MKNSVINLKKKILLVVVIILLIIISVFTVGNVFVINDIQKENKTIDILEKEEYELNNNEYVIPNIDNQDTKDNEEKNDVENPDNESIIEDEYKSDSKNENKEEVKKEENSSTPSISKTFVSSKKVNEDIVSYKYGVKITTTTTYKVDTYSDGSEEKTKISSKSIYDKTTFNATSNDLKSEASMLTSKNKSIYQEVLKYVNDYRSEVGENNLTLDTNLTIAATIRALEMAYTDKFSHTRPDGSNCFTVLEDLGIVTYASGENIAYGYSNAASVSKGWKDSEGHYKNMIDGDFSKVGIGMAQLDEYKYWVQIFSN